MNNAARTYRSLYADIMERQDMRVKDADSTDEIIKTKLRSRKQSAIKLDELRLENMSAKEKRAFNTGARQRRNGAKYPQRVYYP